MDKHRQTLYMPLRDRKDSLIMEDFYRYCGIECIALLLSSCQIQMGKWDQILVWLIEKELGMVFQAGTYSIILSIIDHQKILDEPLSDIGY